MGGITIRKINQLLGLLCEDNFYSKDYMTCRQFHSLVVFVKGSINFFPPRFAWDEAKYPLVNPLRETVDTIQGNVTKLEDDLKVCFFS